jgi:3-oxoacyl-[acyl-carrier-protein] synthase III
MYINFVSSYLPETIISNDYFLNLNGLTDQWIVERTGIKERRKASGFENTNTMGIEAVKNALAGIPYNKDEINLIVGATYTPFDTIVTLGHAVQNYLQLIDIPVVTITSACSSLINALEIAQGYFALGKADKALIVVSENNTAYSNDADKYSGHLWGDGATALLVSKSKVSNSDIKVIDIMTGGVANVGKSQKAIVLQPANGGLLMEFGKDIFIHACHYMSSMTKKILEKNNYKIQDLSYFIPHQANQRITKNVGESLGLADEKVLKNIEFFGNTGSAGCGIVLAENLSKLKKGDLIAVSVFGGGYSYGAMLMEKE